MVHNLSFKPLGEHAILVEWPQVINEAILKDILNLQQKLRKINIKSLVEVRLAYNSLLIIYDKYYKGFDVEISLINKIYGTDNVSEKTDALLWRIPVCYDACFGIDLELISKEKNMAIKELIQRHCSIIYTVYFIGFLPGFLYLGGLDERLITPRKATPRMKIEKGAVAIGGNQTGVYPSESPGGWNIIGNSPIDFFNPNKETPCFAKAGDKIEFYPVSLKQYHDIKTLVNANVYQIENKALHD
jgi:inhibitor of KinA